MPKIQLYSKRLAGLVAAVTVSALLILGVAIGGSYLLTIHSVNSGNASRHTSHCTDLKQLVGAAVKANAGAKYPFGKDKSFGYEYTIGLQNYYKNQCG